MPVSFMVPVPVVARDRLRTLERVLLDEHGEWFKTGKG
jgi:hypothetical protein